MPRSLAHATIIPQHLYVEREADRQLNNIIEEMGRPGYVLVARQMGKTNLLFNMKRNREAKGDLVVYFDLTNRFDNPRALFRFIIDEILDADTKLGNTIFGVEADRRSSDSAPNLEYDRHLRRLLRETGYNRIVIILDEIDSLISVEYSDLFFAQIRSMYFSRINYPEYEKLTYVLSGVAEPTDLIKDKNISPFNIGEKIYLDDFTMSEFQQFLLNASSSFPDRVAEEIYSWACGNPRMTWDICAELQDVEIKRSLTIADVDAVVQKLYLTRFDRAPIDHIRVLVESEKQLSTAVSMIRSGGADLLDEKIKSRLYLAGISSAHGSSIKNPIINLALSDEWLRQIEKSRPSLLDAASDHFKHGRFRQSIEATQEYLRQRPGEPELGHLHSFQLGVAQYYEGQFEEAVQHLTRASTALSNFDLVTASKFHLGNTFVKLQQFEKAITIFNEVVNYDSDLQNEARLGLTSACLAHDAGKHAQLIESMGRQIIDSLSSGFGEPATDPEDRVILTSAYFLLAEAFAANCDFANALLHRRAAFKIAPASFKPAILLRSRTDTQTPLDLADNAILAAEIIIESNLQFERKSSSPLAFNEEKLATVFLCLERVGCSEIFDELMKHTETRLYAETRSPFSILLHLIEVNMSEAALLAPLAQAALERYQDEKVPHHLKLEALRIAKTLGEISPGNA